LFPEFKYADDRFCNVQFGGRSWAKLLVWAFVAGFSERLVRQFLNELTGKPFKDKARRN